MKTKVLICGATGFIGRNLTEQLSKRQDLEVHAVRYQHAAYDCGSDVIWHQADLRRQDDVDRVVKGMDVIIHAAATINSVKELAAKPYAHLTDNMIMNSYLFRSACEHKVKHLIAFSSADIYQASDVAQCESDFDANKPARAEQAGFTENKIHLEKMCAFYSSFSSMKCTAIRLSHVYGPHTKFDLDRAHLLGNLITKAMTSKDKLVISGEGNEKNDFLYIDDLVHFVEAVMAKQEEMLRIYNCGHSETLRTTDLANKIIQHTGKELSIEYDLTQPKTDNSHSLNCTLAQNELTWNAQIDIDTGIRKTVSWCRENVRLKMTEPA